VASQTDWRARARGPGLVDLGERGLRARLCLRRIAELSGIGHGTISALIYGTPGRRNKPTKQIRSSTERRLLALRFHPAQLAGGQRVDATGTRRRLQALAVLGWSIPVLTPYTHRSARTLRRALTAATVTADTARSVAVVYERLRTVPPTHRP